MSKNLSPFAKGKNLEKKMSEKIHAKELPVLISPQFLRDRRMGQIDLAILLKNNKEKLLTIYEVKSSMNVALWQRRRLLDSSHYIGLLLNAGVKLKVVCEESCNI